MNKLVMLLPLLVLAGCATPEQPKGMPGERAENCQQYEGYLYEECMAGAPLSYDQYDVERESLPDDDTVQ